MGIPRGQQSTVVELIQGAGRPLSADEVRDCLRYTGIGLATVYRALKRGVAEGLLRAVHLPEGGARYEPTGLDHHHHFECGECHGVFCLEGCPPGLDQLVPPGFVLRAHDIVLHGLCSNCRENAVA